MRAAKTIKIFMVMIAYLSSPIKYEQLNSLMALPCIHYSFIRFFFEKKSCHFPNLPFFIAGRDQINVKMCVFAYLLHD